MSGIYIPGLKDLSCDDCFWGIGSRLGCHATPEAVTRKINGRAADCPLIFLGDHGRLVDVAALIDKHFGKKYLERAMTASKDDMGTALVNIPIVINNAPTIIPADEEAEK